MRGPSGFAAALFGAFLLAGSAPAVKRLPPGSWGGEHIGLEVTDSGATLDYDCAHGAIAGPITIDAKGGFDVKGVHAREHGGPVRRDEPSSEGPAHIVGRVIGDVMTLRVTLESGEKVGSFTLRRGVEAGVVKCR